MTDKEKYSTEKAWEGAENPETKYWRNMAEHFRKENKELKKKLQQLQKTKAVRRLNEQEVHFEMKLAEQEMYIEQLEKKIESLETISREILDERDFIRLFGHQCGG